MAMATLVKSEKSKKLKRDVSEFIEDGDIEMALKTLRDGLKATKVSRFRDPKKPRGVQYTDKPDHAVRFSSAKLMLEYGFGKPATRAEISSTDDTQRTASPAEIMARFQQSGSQLAQIIDVYSEAAAESTLELENDG